MKLRCSAWIVCTILACTTAPNIQQPATPPALSFVITSTGVYELEDTPALIWRNNGKLPTEEAFYFSHMIFACTDLTAAKRAIEQESTTKSLAFIFEVVEPLKILNIQTHPVFCKKKKKYLQAALPIIRQNDRYVNDPTMKGNRKRQEFSIGYEVADDCNKLNEKRRLPSMERFGGMPKGSGWLEAFKVVYDTENLIVRQVSYELNFLGSSETAPGNCQNFELGREHDFLKVINFGNAYKRAAQVGDQGSLSDVIRPGGRKSQSVKRANDPNDTYKLVERNLPEFKKSRLVMEAEQPQTPEDDPFDIDDIDNIDLINLDPPPWDIDEHSCLRSLTDSNNPTTSTPSSKPQGESSKCNQRPQPNAEPSEEEYMVMQQLAPIEYFDVFPMQWVTCTYLNVAPMWRSLASGPWKRVDRAIRKMLYVIDKLFIIAGTHGVLQLPKRRPPNQYQNVFLRSMGKDIMVPMLFYKFVVHKVPLPAPPGDSFSFGIIIVMHNEFGVPRERICPTDEVNLCSKYGWDVGSEDDKIARPYCCKPTPATLAALDITPYSSKIGYLDLNSVVVEITGDGENLVRNYNQFQNERYPVAAKKKGKTKKLNDIYF